MLQSILQRFENYFFSQKWSIFWYEFALVFICASSLVGMLVSLKEKTAIAFFAQNELRSEYGAYTIK